MRLRVFAPTHVEVDAEVLRVAVQGEAGAFTMLPRHVDVVAVLEPGLLAFEPETGEEVFVAVDGGTVVKVGDDVLVSTPSAIRGTDLDAMRRTLEETFLERDEREVAAGLALTRLEVDMVQRMVELEEGGVP